MRYSHSSPLIGLLTLLAAGVIGGLGGVVYKMLLVDLPPFTILFLRVCMVLLFLLPFAGRLAQRIRQYRWRLLALNGLWFGNAVFFIIGVQWTTAIASQLLYAGVPFLIILINAVAKRERIATPQVVGLIIGFFGVVIVLFGSRADDLSFGSLRGNLLIFFASVAWAFYLVYSKQLVATITPVHLSFDSALLAPFIVGPLLFVFEGWSGVTRLPHFSLFQWSLLLFIGIGVGVAMTVLYQRGMQHSSALSAGSMVYISTLTGVVGGALVLHERVTLIFLLGAFLILFGVFLTTTMPLFRGRDIVSSSTS